MNDDVLPPSRAVATAKEAETPSISQRLREIADDLFSRPGGTDVDKGFAIRFRALADELDKKARSVYGVLGGTSELTRTFRNLAASIGEIE